MDREQDGTKRKRECIYIVPASKKDDRLIAVSLRQESSKLQKTCRTRRSEIVSAMMSHILMLLSWFFW